MAFQVQKRLDLGYLGDGWSQGTYLKFSSLTFSETREFAGLSTDTNNPDSKTNIESLDIVLGIVKRHFIEGIGWDGQKLSSITADDLPELPTDVIMKSLEVLAGTGDPKSQTP